MACRERYDTNPCFNARARCQVPRQHRHCRADRHLSLRAGPCRADEPAGYDTASTLACNGLLLETFSFEDSLRPEAGSTTDGLRAHGLAVEMISGDRPRPVARIVATLEIEHFLEGATPSGKTAHLAALAARGRIVLMVGDGLNDAPALVAASVSMAPASAADFVFLRPGLDAVRATADEINAAAAGASCQA